jgi:Right handed beta helix region
VHVKTRAELQKAAAQAVPGTKIMIAPGTYAGGLLFANLHGTKERPIVFAAADESRPPVIQGGGNCLHLSEPAHVELHNLIFEKGEGNGLNIDDGGSKTPAQHVVLRGLIVRDIGSEGNHDGIKLSGLNDFLVENCTVERWGKQGSGIDMVGCHRGVVAHSTLRTGGHLGANGVQIKGGSSQVNIRFCRFENAGGRGVNLGGSTGLAYFRPAPQGYEAKDLTVEDCTFIGSQAPLAFVGVDGATVRHNTFYGPKRWLLRILQENQEAGFVPCRNGKMTNNIIAFRSDELVAVSNIGPKTAPETFHFSENFWHCIDKPERAMRIVQLPTAETKGIYGQDPKFSNPADGDLQLTADSPAREFGPRVR